MVCLNYGVVNKGITSNRSYNSLGAILMNAPRIVRKGHLWALVSSRIT